MESPGNISLSTVPFPKGSNIPPRIIYRISTTRHLSFLIESIDLLVLLHHKIFLFQRVSKLLISFFHLEDSLAIALRIIGVLRGVGSFELNLVDCVEED